MNHSGGCLAEQAGGVVIQVKALAAARRNELRGVENGRLKVATTAAPEKGRANEAILRQVADVLQVPARQVELLRGATSNQKTILVHGISLNEVRERLLAAGCPV